jgi:hypothetical protein
MNKATNILDATVFFAVSALMTLGFLAMLPTV